MKTWSLDCWRWLQSRVPSSAKFRPNRLRRGAATQARVAADVEVLESRVLLTFVYQGGPLLTNVQLQPVFLGSDWTLPANAATMNKLNTFAQTFVTSTALDGLTAAGYGVGRGSALPGIVDNIPLNKNGYVGVTDVQIQADIQSMILNKAAGLQQPNANTLYMVYPEPGVVIYQGSASSINTFLGYHFSFQGQNAGHAKMNIFYGVIAYPGNGTANQNVTSASQGFASDIDDLTSVTSHETMEAATDPGVGPGAVGGWRDTTSGNEVCDGFFTPTFGPGPQRVLEYLGPGSTNYIQGFWTIDDNVHIATKALVAPVISSVTAVSATAAQVTWSLVPEAEHYQIFSLTGGKHAVSGLLSATTTSAVASNLLPGASNNLVVEASATGVNFPVPASAVDSAGFLFTTPAALAAPVVNAPVILSNTTAQLSWNSVAGADGYRIYEKIGNQVYFIGTVGASTTSVILTGLKHGQTEQFMIEAFAGFVFSDSAWKNVLT